MPNHLLVLLVPLLPLASVFLLLGLFGRTYFNATQWLSAIGTLALLAAAVLAIVIANNIFLLDGQGKRCLPACTGI